MLDKILKIHLVLFFILSAFCSLGQSSVEINRPVLFFGNERLYITYDLDDKGTSYEVKIEIINSAGTKINANALSGEIGTNIKAGKNKSIVWDLAKDNVFLDETISVKIVAHLIPKSYSKGKLVIQSTIWPGWGQTKLKNGKPYWLIGIAGVACLGGSYWYNQQSVSSYNQYKDATNLTDNEKYYDQAIQQDNTSKILAYSAIGIWAVNILWVALMPDKTNSKISPRNVSFLILPANAGSNNTSVSLGLSLNLKL